ncbi:TetR/AcrR family transcriptional regulator [Nonomuraea typhae]|uniref:TetR/AcrR family transcriptional regulator n=1 Tax=Nonomuraea typhae TaxID=2603600 RepID=UPI0012FC8550|nr:TetR/AcrR family transcriptional regulator [Nonomuraea typhae]
MAAEAGSRPRGRPRGSGGAELLAIAREVFLTQGYPGATMDQVAAQARISKQTLYREYPSKERLYAAVVRDWVDRGYDAMRPHTEALTESADIRAGLLRLAHVLHSGVLSEPVLRMRSLVATESARFPDVAADYVERSWTRNTQLLADALAALAARGLIKAEDTLAAAQQFTWLVLGDPLNRRTLAAQSAPAEDDELARQREEAVTTFLSRYGHASAWQ